MNTDDIALLIAALATVVAAATVAIASSRSLPHRPRLAKSPTGDCRPTTFEPPTALPAPPRMVVVNTQKPDDQSLRGQMVDDGQQSGWVVLRAPSLHVAGGEGTASWEKLPADVSIVSNETGILGGVALWRD